MKITLTISILLCTLFNTKAQLYQLFYFEENKPLVYDTVLQKVATEASKHYYYGNIDSSILKYKSLYFIRPSFKIEYNLAVLYGLSNNKDSVIVYLSKYISNKEKCECAYLNKFEFKELMLDNILEVIKSKCEIIQKSKGINNISLYNKYAYIYGKDQEILGASAYRDIKEERRELMSSFFDIIDSVGIPNEEEITIVGMNYFRTLLLHADFFPDKQIVLATKMLKSKKTSIHIKKQLAYIIDRGYCNLNQPQLYGTILSINSFTNQKCLYQFDSYSKLTKRRKKMGFQPVSEFLKNNSILK